MKTAQVRLTSVSPYSQSRHYTTDKLPKELPKDYEKRTWRDRLHVNETGMVIIPQMALKNCLSECAKFLGIQVPGKGKANYTKHFEAGLLVLEPLDLGIKADEVSGEWLFVPSDGRRGSGSRVEKCFPIIPQWQATATIYVLDETITQDVLDLHLDQAGKFIGMGRFRPRNNGFYGRFDAEIVAFE